MGEGRGERRSRKLFAKEMSISAKAVQPLSMNTDEDFCHWESSGERIPGRRILSHGNVESHELSSTVEPEWGSKLDGELFPHFSGVGGGIVQRQEHRDRNLHRSIGKDFLVLGVSFLQGSEDHGDEKTWS